MMKNYNDALKYEGYRKHSRGLYSSQQFSELLGNDILFYNTFIESGFTDWYTYYSMVIHEFYLITVEEEIKCFVWRHGGPYRVEFRNEEMSLKLIKSIDEVPTKQIDALTIEFKHMSTSVIKAISNICK